MPRLLVELYNTNIQQGKDDTLVWTPSPQQGFQVKSYYNTLQGGGADFLWKSIWKTCIPLRVAFFSWCAVLGRILIA